MQFFKFFFFKKFAHSNFFVPIDDTLAFAPTFALAQGPCQDFALVFALAPSGPGVSECSLTCTVLVHAPLWCAQFWCMHQFDALVSARSRAQKQRVTKSSQEKA